MTSLKLTGRVTVRAHPPGARYSRALLESGRVLASERNAILAAGLDYIAIMLLADPINDPQKYGITEIGLSSSVGEVHKQVLTDHYTSGPAVVSVLFLPSAQPATQPVDLTAATLYMDDPAATTLATRAFSPAITKTNLLALTVDWQLQLSPA